MGLLVVGTTGDWSCMEVCRAAGVGATVNDHGTGRPVLPADNLSVTKAFYVERLGFRVTWEATEDGKTGLMGIERGR